MVEELKQNLKFKTIKGINSNDLNPTDQSHFLLHQGPDLGIEGWPLLECNLFGIQLS